MNNAKQTNSLASGAMPIPRTETEYLQQQASLAKAGFKRTACGIQQSVLQTAPAKWVERNPVIATTVAVAGGVLVMRLLSRSEAPVSEAPPLAPSSAPPATAKPTSDFNALISQFLSPPFDALAQSAIHLLF